jgi:hypothetical protein
VNLKTAHFTNAWHAASGGISTFYRALLRAAERRRHFMRLVVPGEADSVQDIGEYGRIYYVQAPRAAFNPEYRMLYPTQYMPQGSKLRRILQVERPDLVEINDKYSLQYIGGFLRERWIKEVARRPRLLAGT